MNKCIKCGSYAFNLHKDNIDQGSLCDVHYWQGKAHRAEAQPEQEPVACKRCKQLEEQGYDLLGKLKVANIKLSMRSQRIWAGLMRGVRVEGDTVVIKVKNGNDAARKLCGALIEEMNK